MAISSVGDATPEEQPKKISEDGKLDEQESQESQKGQEKMDQSVSIWDTNRDGTVTVDEQMEAIQNAVAFNLDIKYAKVFGFDEQSFIDALGPLEKIVTNTQTLVEGANKKVQSYIDSLIWDAKDYLRKQYNDSISSSLTNSLERWLEAWGHNNKDV